MTKSILIELLRKFTPKEMKEFCEFVNSPFFNKNEGVIKLYEYLRKHYPDFPENKIDKKYIYGVIFPKLEYNDGFMRTLMFNLSCLAENYLSYTIFKKNYFVDKRFLLYELNNRELDRLFERNINAVTKKLQDEQIQDADFFYNKYNIEYENLYYLGRTKLDKIEAIVKKSDVEDMFSNLTCFYLVHSMNHYTYFLNIMKLYHFTFDTALYEEIMKALNVESYLDIPIVAVCYNVLMLFLKEDDSSYFYKTKELLNKYESKLTNYLLNNAYLNLNNYCKRMILKGNESFLRELFEIYKIAINRKIYPLQNEMSFRYYTDVVETALKLKEFKWAKDFIKNKKDMLPEDSRENTYFYALSIYELENKNFEKSLELLSKVKYNDIYHKLKLRGYLTMLYYELDYGDMLLSHLDSFNHFLLGDTLISDERKEYYSSFIKFVKCLSNIKIKYKGNELMNLKEKVLQCDKLYNKEWLLEKIEQEQD